MVLSFFQINIPRRSEVCAHGQERIEPGANYYSILLEKNQEITRQDFCTSCWKQFEESASLPSEIYWKSKASLKKEEKVKSKDKESRALDLLKDILRDNTPETKAETFILALFLARRRWLYLRQQITQEDGQLINLYEVAATEEILAVTRITLSPTDIQNVQQSLAAKLNSDSR